jgi:tetratricopeptide (TPR) repeat protein
LPAKVVEELSTAAPPRRGSSLERRLADAARAYEAGRYQDARRLLRPLVDAAPNAGSVRELHGLTLYRQGHWRDALKELRVAHQLTGSYDQYPVLADCERALGHYDAVVDLWNELRRASPGPEVLAEGRIVVAGAAADRGRIGEAIALLEPVAADRARPREYHLRTWYALADLYERAGEVPRAREVFRRLARHDREFHDVAERLAAL